MPATPILAPLVNPNEPEALLQAIHTPEKQAVSKGEVLCTLETTKSTLEVEAPEAATWWDGASPQDRWWQPEKRSVISPNPPSGRPPRLAESGPAPPPDGRRFTQPALALAREHALDLESFAAGVLITEAMVREAIQGARSKELVIPESVFDPTAILVYGGGGHGKALIDLLRALSVYRIVGIVDDGIQPRCASDGAARARR